jgi:hypothetical protein
MEILRLKDDRMVVIGADGIEFLTIRDFQVTKTSVVRLPYSIKVDKRVRVYVPK